MAFKRYAYYNKGNKVAIVEESSHSTSGFLAVAHCTLSGYTTKATCEAAGGQWIPSSGSSTSDTMYEKYTSPTESISKGIEIEYSYTPTFNIQSTLTEGSDFHRFIGWGSNGTNLLLFTYGASDVADLSSLFAADDWIYISGSGRWSGLHQVKSAGSATGILTLKTKCNLKPSVLTDIVVDIADELYIGDTNTQKMDIEAFKDAQDYRGTSYIFVENAVNADGNGIFSLSDTSNSGALNVNNQITIDADGDYTSTAANVTTAGNDTVSIYNIFYEQISVYEGIEALEDESFELDLTEYQAQAVVYYVKAKLSEDMRDMEGREFFMRLFKKQMEKGASSRKRGPYIVRGFF